MLIKPDCISCILKMAITAIRKLTEDEARIQDLTVAILTLPALQGRQWDVSSPEVIEGVMERLITAFNTQDPFEPLKEEQNRVAESLYPTLRGWIQEAEDPLETAVKMAITGNAIDLMVSDRTVDLLDTIRRELKQPLPPGPLARFREKLLASRSLVYLGDNCGEIVFDRLFLETLRGIRDMEVRFVVRGRPALNDATRKEAEAVGIPGVALLMENGCEGPVPGTLLARCSPALRDAIQNADLVISKGGGNFDTLEGESELRTDASFLLLSKCVPYCRYFHTEMFRPVLANVFAS